MEPLSIIASVIALCQAADRSLILINRIRCVLRASDEIRALQRDIQRLGLVLQAFAEVPQICQAPAQSGLRVIVKDCETALYKLEIILEGCLKAATSDGSISELGLRLRWSKYRANAEFWRQQLRDAFSALGLYLQVVSMQAWYSVPQPSRLGRVTAVRTIETSQLQSATCLFQAWVPEESFAPDLSLAGLNRQSFPPRDQVPGFSFFSNSSEGGAELMSTINSVNPLLDPRCICSCHKRTTSSKKTRQGILGSVYIYRSGGSLWPRACTSPSCRNVCAAHMLFHFLPPLWISRVSMALAVSSSTRLRISLSFPRLLPPDEEFFLCIRSGEHQRVKELLSSGTAHIADIAAPYGLSSLQLATIHNQVEVMQVLIAAGALHTPPLWNWSPRDMYDHFATHSLIQSNLASNELIQDLHKIYAPSMRRPADRELLCLEGEHLTRLHKIVLGFSLEALENVPLVETRHLIIGLDSFNRTALYWAAKLDDARAVRYLLASGADPGIADVNGALPLHVAVGQGNIDCVRLLASFSAQIEIRDRTGATPMHYACSKADPAVIDILLNFGADIEARNFVGESPIYRASHARRGNIVRHLADRGASLQHRDSWGYSPLQDTVMMDSHEALTYLISRSDTTSKLFDGKTLLHTCALHSGIQTIEILLQNDLGNIDPYVKDDAGFTALDYLW